MTETTHSSDLFTNPPAAKTLPEGIPLRLQDLATQVATESRRRFGTDTRIIWFGSWVKGTARPHSDVDLAVDSASASSMEFAALCDWVDNLATLYSIDLVNLHEVGDTLRDAISSEGVLL